jgi:hypothetical protein
MYMTGLDLVKPVTPLQLSFSVEAPATHSIYIAVKTIIKLALPFLRPLIIIIIRVVGSGPTMALKMLLHLTFKRWLHC